VAVTPFVASESPGSPQAESLVRYSAAAAIATVAHGGPRRPPAELVVRLQPVRRSGPGPPSVTRDGLAAERSRDGPGPTVALGQPEARPGGARVVSHGASLNDVLGVAASMGYNRLNSAGSLWTIYYW
jgi:hypothetical protein